MNPLIEIVRVGVYSIMGLSIIAALGVVTMRNLFHAALCLAAVLLGIAGIFVFLQADFLAAVQILIYVGAVMTLVIFAIMLTQRFGDKSIAQNNRLGLSAFAGAIVFIVAMARVVLGTAWPTSEGIALAEREISVIDLGKALMGEFIFPFEVISVILIAVLIGSIVIAKKNKV